LVEDVFIALGFAVFDVLRFVCACVGDPPNKTPVIKIYVKFV
jgi:hypothetical protein